MLLCSGRHALLSAVGLLLPAFLFAQKGVIDQGEAAPFGPNYPTGGRVVATEIWREALLQAGVVDREAKNPRTDFRRLLAFSSISHLGFVLLGLFPVAEGPEVPALAGLGIDLARIEPKLARAKLANHGMALCDRGPLVPTAENISKPCAGWRASFMVGE